MIFKELARVISTGEIADGILKYYNNSDKINFVENIKSYKENFTWNKFIEKIERIFIQ